MHLTEYLALFLIVLAGGAAAFYFQKNSREILKIVLPFCGAYIFGITVLHLMPEVFASGQSRIGLWVLAGFFLQLMLEQLSRGVEHGHIHPAHDEKPQFAFSVMVGLGAHAFLEGMPLDSAHTHLHGNHLFWAVFVHKFPEAFALTLLFLFSGFSKSMVAVCLAAFALMTPGGAYLAQSFDGRPGWASALLALVIGSFLHIATTILFEVDNTRHHRIPWQKMVAIALGLGVALGSLAKE